MQPVSSSLFIRILPATLSRAAGETAPHACRHSAPVRWEEPPAACHSVAWHQGDVMMPCQAYERNVSIPVKLTSLKPETINECRHAFFCPQQEIISFANRASASAFFVRRTFKFFAS